jgi:DNA-directed RNA polymerase specialized sigma24 family protein
MRPKAKTETESKVEKPTQLPLPEHVEPDKTPAHVLLALMAQKDGREDLIQDACTELYQRYVPRLLGVARKWEFMGPKYDGELLVSDTMLRAYRHAHRFVYVPESDPERADQKVLIWLFKILQSRIMDNCRIKASKERDIEETLRGGPQHKEGLGDRLKLLDSRRVHLRKFMMTLSPDDAYILLTSYKYYDYAREKCEPPADIRKEICSRLKITTGNLRVKRTRLVASLKCFIQSCQNAPSEGNL